MMAAEALSRRQPQKATRAETEAQETRRALQWAKDKLRQEGQPNANFSDMIWRALQDAAETLSRLPDKEMGWLLSAGRSVWPEIARPSEDNRQVEAQIANEINILRIRSHDHEWRPGLTISDPSAENRMLTVLNWLRHVRAMTPRGLKRDKIVTLALAQGQPLARVRPLMEAHRTDRAIYMVKRKVIAHIANGIWRHWQ